VKKIHPLLLSGLSGLLLFFAWPVSPLTFLIFVGFIPLLLLADQTPKRGRFFAWTYITMAVWNIGTTWWVCNSTIPGGIAAIAANSLIMCIPWMGFYNIKKRMGETVAFPALILFWMSFEYIHLNWQLSWPWLILGNVFATHPGWVQWYEYTGASGGTLWVLLMNWLLFLLLREKWLTAILNIRYLLSALLVLIIPLLVSTLPHWEPAPNATASAGNPNIVIVQPNVDPWDEKFVAGKEEAQLRKLIRLSESRIDPHTALVVWPETAVPVAINEDEVKTSYFMAPVWDFLKRHPSVNLLTGIEGFRFYDALHKTPYSTKIPGSEKYAETYNSAAIMDSNDFRIYHKSKLVPGVETLPPFLHFLDTWFEKFGGTTGGYVPQEERTVLSTFNNTYRIAPAICYESIYGEFMSKYVRDGADLIVIITNDGWWGNTAGHKQHENYARLRAIETRRWIARSANTGISCFIDPIGNIIDPQSWDTQSAIKMEVPVEKSLTFYARHGDLLSRLAILGAMVLLLWNGIVIIRTLIAKKSKPPVPENSIPAGGQL
jgi:apolipoprotein N-acyltransferase